MIQIDEIDIHEFRGIRHLTLTLGQKSFGIAGPNGTGKSGIVDAIEFGLTGNVSRLGGEGTAELSVREHAPHVDSSKNPENAVIKIKGYAPSLGRSITIERSVAAAASPVLTPDDDKTREFAARLQTHPEFALSRREIIKYILTPPGKRSTDVQTLLRLEQVEKVRKSLQRVANDARREAARTLAEDGRTLQDFLRHLGLKSPGKMALLAAVNERRALLKLEPLADLTAEVSIKAGVIADASKAAKLRLSKAGTLAELAIYAEQINDVANGAARSSITGSLDILAKLSASPVLLKSVKQKMLVEHGLALIDDECCPLCDSAWDMEELRAHLGEKLAKATEATGVMDELANAIRPVTEVLDAISVSGNKIAQACGNTDPAIDATAIRRFVQGCADDRAALEKVSIDPAGIPAAVEALRRLAEPVPADAVAAVTTLRKWVDALPEPSKEEAAKEYLIVAQEKYDRCRAAKADANAAQTRAETAGKVFEAYGAVSTVVLEGIYDTV